MGSHIKKMSLVMDSHRITQMVFDSLRIQKQVTGSRITKSRVLASHKINQIHLVIFG